MAKAGEGAAQSPPQHQGADGGVRVLTFGCRLNTYELEAMRDPPPRHRGRCVPRPRGR